MRLLLIGAPGAGKGTQAELLAKRFNITHISSGDLLRYHVQNQTAIGQRIKAYVDAGDLVPDAVVMDMLRKPVVAASEAGGYVLDGFPRTVDQAKAAFETARALGVEVQAAVHLDVQDEELIRRLLARGRGSDDTEDVIAHRLRVYREKTIPLLEYYASREWMFAVDGSRPPDEVHRDIVGRLRKLAAFDASPGWSVSPGESARESANGYLAEKPPST
jgi:adenylate kinase